MKFFLGTHKPQWLGRTAVPLFVSHRWLSGRVTLPRAAGPWALDSGAYTELGIYGRWTVEPRAYAAAVRRFRDEVGLMEWAAIQDWLCVPSVLKSTALEEGVIQPDAERVALIPPGLKPSDRRDRVLATCRALTPDEEFERVKLHQERTVESYATLLAIAPDLPWVPVLQGLTVEDYLRHLHMYGRRGLDVRKAPVLGIGSVVKRQHTEAIANLIRGLASLGYRLHGFGFKFRGLALAADALASADSSSWSLNGRKEGLAGRGHPGCTHKHCGNCMAWALRWREQLLAALGGGRGEAFADRRAREMADF